MRQLFVILLMLTTNLAQANLQTKGYLDAAIIQPREDGFIDIVCRNGNRELITFQEFFTNNACPNPRNSVETGMRLVLPREDGQFNVTCRNQVQLVTTQEKILAGEICLPTLVPVLEAGTYRAAEGYLNYFDQTVTPLMEGDIMKGINLSLSIFPAQAELSCKGAICLGKWSFGDQVQVEIKSAKSYQYSRVDAQGNLIKTAVFQK